MKDTIEDGIEWLKKSIPNYFGKLDFDIEQDEDEKKYKSVLLKIYGNLQSEKFRQFRHDMSKDMLENGLKKLYDAIRVFQRRIKQNKH